MIKTKRDLNYYLAQDKRALGIKRKRPNLFGDEIWKFQRILRKYEYAVNQNEKSLWGKMKCLMLRFKYHNLSLKLGFSIPINVFGPGLAIVHYGTIVVSSGAKIGANCRIHEGVTIGATNGSSVAATIGNNVFIGSGAKIIGDIKISSNVAIAANAVVVSDVISEEGCTVGGVPAKVISKNNSKLNIHILDKS